MAKPAKEPEHSSVDVEDEVVDFTGITGKGVSEAVVFNTDWTAETVTQQTSTIAIEPRFQRRDAWSKEKKSKFIESLVLGLPVPPIVLAEQKQKRGQFLVLDGKQRLLAIWQFWGLHLDSPNNKYKLSGLEVRKDLAGVDFEALKVNHQDDFSTLRNQTIRTVVIRNWPNEEFLHLVFLRLNTGSTKLSAQELRQALKPGDFTEYVDRVAATSVPLRQLLGNDGPDPRMQDTEILGRHLAFENFFSEYPGRMKAFIDNAFLQLNREWVKQAEPVEKQVQAFEAALTSLADVLGEELVARKPGSRLLNKALLDPLVYYFAQEKVRAALGKSSTKFKRQYDELFKDEKFLESVSLDTASTEGVVYRFRRIAEALKVSNGMELPIPKVKPGKGKKSSGVVLS